MNLGYYKSLFVCTYSLSFVIFFKSKKIVIANFVIIKFFGSFIFLWNMYMQILCILATNLITKISCMPKWTLPQRQWQPCDLNSLLKSDFELFREIFGWRKNYNQIECCPVITRINFFNEYCGYSNWLMLTLLKGWLFVFSVINSETIQI